jgi:hypothetical protein
MLIAELIHSCSHERVAHAALLSIGADFHRKVNALARISGQTGAAFAVARVSEFALKADVAQWSGIASAMSGKDMPVLSGLRYILEPHLAAAHARGGAQINGHEYWITPAYGSAELRPEC